MNDIMVSDGGTKLSDLNAIQVYASPLPFSNKQVKALAAEGDSIYDVVNSIVPDGYDGHVGVVITINGYVIPYDKWRVVRPKQGTIVNIRVIPAGGGGKKNPIATILTIAVAFAAPYLGAAFANTAALATFGGGVATAGQIAFMKTAISLGISVVGRLAIAAIAPPPKPSNAGRVNNPTESPTQFIEGARNSLLPFGVVPVCLGINRMFPLQAARPYTETQNNDNYVRQLFTWGYGNIVVNDLKIGETSISEFDDVEIEHRLNGDLNQPTGLYSNSVFQEDFNVLLEQVDGFTTRTTQLEADEAIVDITFNGLTNINRETGGRGSRFIDFEIEFANVDTPTDWQSGISFKEYSGRTFALPTPPTQNVRINNIRTVVGTGVHEFYLNKFTGALSIYSAYTTKNDPFNLLGNVLPQRPSDSIRVASLEYVSENGVLTVENFSDDRQTSLFGILLEDSDSFVPTVVGNQLIISDGKLASPIRITGAQTEPLRYSHRIVFPEQGQYLVRIRRVTGDTTSQYVIDKSFLTALKTVTYEAPVEQINVSGTAVRMRATDQLNGSLDQLNGVVASIIPDYDLDTDTWVDRISNNPAALYRYVLQAPFNVRALPDSKIAIQALQDWYNYCEEQQYSYNRVIDYEASIDDVLRDIASAGAASPAIVDGKRTVVIDRVKDDIVQMITPRNSWGYEGEMIYTIIPDAFRVQFRNSEKGYIQDELIVYNDGFDENNAEIFETLELQYCTNSDLAFKTARRHMAAIKLRPEVHSFNMDIENLVALRGDRVKFVNDVVLIGIGDARIKTVETNVDDFITGITVDDDISVPSVGSYYVRIRLKDGTQLYKQVNTTVGTTNEFTFTTPFDDGLPEKGDLCYFTEAGQEKDLIILSIQPGSDLTAQITAIDYAPEIFNAENEPIPTFDSKITTPLEFIRPDAPILGQVLTDETVMQRNVDGSFLTRAIISLSNTNSGAVVPIIKIRETGTTQFRSATVIESSPEQVILTGLQDNTRYDIHIRYRRAESNAISLPLQLNNLLFIGGGGLPSQVTGFKINVIDGSAILEWDRNLDIDISHYIIKFSGVFSGATWGTAQGLKDKIFETRITVPFQSGTYLIKAVDYFGNESENATAIITYDQGNVRNVVEELIENPTWDGVKDNTIITDERLTLRGIDALGYYYFEDTIDLGAVFTSFVSSTIVAGGTYINNIFDETDIFTMSDVFGVGENNVFTIDDIFIVEDIFGIGNNGWEVQLQFRTTQDDTTSSPTWTEWEDFSVGNYEFRGVEFRLILTSLESNIAPLVSLAKLIVDMPDRIERGEDLTVPVEGVTITYPDKFKKSPAVNITIQDGDSNDEIEFASKTVEGFEFKVYNTTSATYVERTFDYIVSGYGRE